MPGGGSKSNKRDTNDTPNTEHRTSGDTPSASTSRQTHTQGRQTSYGRTGGTGGDTSGCIVRAAGAPNVRLPQLSNNLQLCYRNLVSGMSCPNGNNCQYAHRQYPHLGTFADRHIFEEWVQRTQGITWAQGYGPRPLPNRNGSPPASTGGRGSGGLPPPPPPAGNAASSTALVTFTT
jgi:hypothetical protein